MQLHTEFRFRALTVLLGASLALNLAFILEESVSPDDSESEDGLFMDSNGFAGLTAAQMDTAAEATPVEEDLAEMELAEMGDGWRVTQASVSHSLSKTFTTAVGADGPALSAVFARLFQWDVNLRRDLLAGDQVEVLWRKDAEGMVEIAAARLHSGRHGKTLSAFRWTLPGEEYASYWWEDGTEAAMRLQSSPMNSYDQITALLKDRPNHAGMDFKADTGTPVVSPYDGVITRKNWHWKGNGNCVEVRYSDGVMAKFLHLSEIEVEVGQRVSAGDTIALSGNTGRSTAPHLHYQVERKGHVVDPVDYHGTHRRQLSPAAMKRFQREMSRLEGMLGGEIAQR